MRLLNSSSRQLEAFQASKIPKYAILSHTWEEDADEVSFADTEKGGAEGKAGYQKIKHSCKEAADNQIGYVWIDTCCIDKSSSAELSEAINSMYKWYRRAETCYAYLADVPADVGTDISGSNCFKRGWTLQELIAPSNLVFFSLEWIKVGTKSALCEALAEMTGISEGILAYKADLESASIAKRMS